MKQNFVISFFLVFILCSVSYGQRKLGSVKESEEDRILQDSLDRFSDRDRKSTVRFDKADIVDYNIISKENDTTFVDTTLTIQKFYKYNYLRKDNFNLIAFANVGQTYNTLSHNFSELDHKPRFGARARHFNYMEVEDINYYRVPTPLTELFYKSALEQGQVLDAFFTLNLSERLNLFIGYKGLRSLGNYQGALTSTGNFRVATNYSTKDDKYNVKLHVVTQDLLNNENGGLNEDDVANFRSGDEDFEDRSVFDPNFDNAENILVGKRFYLDHSYKIRNAVDSLRSSGLSFGNIVNFEDKNYRYKQEAAVTEVLGDAFSTNISDEVALEDFEIGAYLNYSNYTLGEFQFNAEYHNINYGYNKLLSINDQTIANRIKQDFFSVGMDYKKIFGKLKFNASILTNLSDDFKGYTGHAIASYALNEDYNFEAALNVSNRRPDYNHLLYQSDYINYNWDNSRNFENQSKQNIQFSFTSNKFFNVEADISNFTNYTYFGLNEANQIKPLQADSPLNYYRIRVNKEFTFGKFALDNTILYQDVLEGDDFLNVPDFITRNTFYYQNHLFDRALYLQTGITFNIFSEYNMNAYDPVLAEFYIQDETKLGAFPRLDFFVNAKIRQTRIFIIAEHFNSSFTGYDYFSAPNYPYRDFVVRFGLVWNFFL